jgi:hypothetical protein
MQIKSVSLWIEFVSVWLHSMFALGSFTTNCFAEKFTIPEITLDESV